METKKQKFGIIGLGKMGGNLALQAHEKGYMVIGMDRTDFRQELKDAAIEHVINVRGFRDNLKKSRIIFLYIPAGAVVDTVLDELSESLEADDVIVDGGNSYWGDSIRRAERLKAKGIRFVDCGTSGGVSGARNGACFMVGGEVEAFEYIKPILTDLAVPGGVVYAGKSGAGHFTKLVHNGIEFGMLQAIGEGISLLEGYRDKLDIKEILKCWNHGSVIRSWLIELMEKAYSEKNGIKAVPPYVEDTGEVNWLVNDAMHMEVPIPVIAQSVMQLIASRDQEKNDAKAIALMRHGFGDHPFGKNESIQRERKYGRVGKFPQV